MDRRRFLQLAALAGLGACTSERATVDVTPVGGASSHAPLPSAAASPTTGPDPSAELQAQPSEEPTAEEPTPAEPTPEEPTPAEPTPVEQAAVLAVLCREAWGAQPPGDGFVGHTIRQLTIHHSAVVLGDNRDAPSRLRQHQRHHQSQGWPDIAYHLGVDRNGNVYDLRPARFRGDTFTAYDPTGHFLVLCEGNFDREQPTDAQLEGAARAFAWAAGTYGAAPATLTGHRDHAQTSCPGDALYARIAELRARVEELAGTGVAREDRCGHEASAYVARVESGDA